MYYVIKRPIVTEKNSVMAEDDNVYVFEVDRKATKTEIREAVEKFFRVKVAGVRTSVGRGRAKRTKIGLGKPRYFKKAMVKLKQGEKISLFEGA